jgi:two-component system, cell cycle sensor histidine kinase and response regulator CckA
MRLSSTLAAYAIAPATVTAALALRVLMHPVLQQEIPYETFYMAVAVSGRYAGLGAGLLAMALGGIAGIYFFVPPHGFTIAGSDNQLAFVIYLFVSAVILRLLDEQRRAQRRAETGQRTLDAILEHIPDGVGIADAPDARVRMVSRWGAEMAGHPQRDFLNLSPKEHTAQWGVMDAHGTPAAWDELPMTRAVRKGELVANEEWMLRRPDGTEVPILVNAAPIVDRKGAITGGLAVWRDISQRKEIEEKLRETAKVESLGVLAGGVAHDFNNLLTSIMGYASLLEDSTPAESSDRRNARAILEAAHTAARLTQQLLAYSGRSRFVVEPLDVSDLLQKMAELIRSSAQHAEVQFELAADLPAVEADASQVRQLVVNLVINAAEAVAEEGGRIRIVTRKVELDEPFLRGLIGADRATPGAYVLLEVQDTGAGMDDDVLPLIFDPFFTTKFTGRGLGLSAVLGIVRGHGGGIKVHSAPGVGTTFRVYLPGRARGTAG